MLQVARDRQGSPINPSLAVLALCQFTSRLVAEPKEEWNLVMFGNHDTTLRHTERTDITESAFHERERTGHCMHNNAAVTRATELPVYCKGSSRFNRRIRKRSVVLFQTEKTPQFIVAGFASSQRPCTSYPEKITQTAPPSPHLKRW